VSSSPNKKVQHLFTFLCLQNIIALMKNEKSEHGEAQNAELRKEIDRLKKTIEEIRSSEDALKKDVGILRSLIENISSGVAVIDEYGKFVLFNNEFLRLFGLIENSINNVNDQNWSEWKVFDENRVLLHVDDHPVRKAALTGKIVRNQVIGVILPSGGDMVWMLVSAEPFMDEYGNVNKIICTYQDFTKSKLADENLIHNEERLRLTLESADLGSWDFDIDTGIAHHSLKHDQIFGYTEPQHEWSYEISIKHMLPEYHQLVRDAVAKAIEAGELYYEARIAWPDGSTHWIAPKGRVLYDKQGKPIRMIGVVSDITERKEFEKILKENEARLRELNETKDKFFSIIAHDLKSPFTSILGFSELMNEKIKTGKYEELNNYAMMIHRSSRHAMELLSNLFEWSRLQTSTMEFKPRELDLVTIINEVKELFSYAAWHKSVLINTHAPDECKIMADKHMISSVLRNLISNALKFSHPESEIVISVTRTPGEVKISVNDNGIGMDRNDIAKLFRLDVNYSTKGTTGEEGSGLGLLLTKDFISRHSGKLFVESEKGKGSTFTFTIPTDEEFII
jgi:PAS domain S-box-containing protein